MSDPKEVKPMSAGQLAELKRYAEDTVGRSTVWAASPAGALWAALIEIERLQGVMRTAAERLRSDSFAGLIRGPRGDVARALEDAANGVA